MGKGYPRHVLLMRVTLLALSLAATASAKPCPKLLLKAAPSTCSVGDSVRLTVTLKGGATPYEVRIYQKARWGMATGDDGHSRLDGQVRHYVTASKAGQLQLKAGAVNSSGAVKSYSNVVTVTSQRLAQ